jgi:hypothetical protein
LTIWGRSRGGSPPCCCCRRYRRSRANTCGCNRRFQCKT